MGATLIANPAETILSGEALRASMIPQQPSAREEILAALRRVKAIDTFAEADLEWLAAHGTEHKIKDGGLAFRGGDPVDGMTLLLRGEIHVRRANGPVAFFIGRSGQLTGKLPFSRMKSYGGDGYAAGDVWTLDFPERPVPGDAAVHSATDPGRRIDLAGSRARSHPHGAAGGEAQRAGQARCQSLA